MTLYHIRMPRAFDIENFTVTPQVGGIAYEVLERNTGMSFFVQDDSARQLETDSAEFTNLDVLREYMATLGQLSARPVAS